MTDSCSVPLTLGEILLVHYAVKLVINYTYCLHNKINRYLYLYLWQFIADKFFSSKNS